MLADSIGATDGITVFYYDRSVSYKYQGKLRARSILNSIHPYMSAASPEELPLKPLNSQEDLKSFIESIDKALILAEFCGWAPKLVAKVKNNGNRTDLTPKVADSGTWMAVRYFKGCPGCSQVIKDEDELKNALMTDNSIVRELQFDGHDLPLALPENKPSVILFVDRSSETSETRRKRYIRKPRLHLSEIAQNIKSKDKMSFMVINEGNHVTLDDIALDLQDDVDMKISQEVPSQTDGQSNDASLLPSEEAPLIGIVDPQSLPMETESALLREEKPHSVGVEVGPSSSYKEDEGISPDKNKHFSSIETEKLLEVDPRSQHHYVYSEETILSYMPISKFLHEYLNGSLVPYQRSVPVLHCPRESTSPPFVNLDFHEVDSIPQVTMHTLTKLVFGSNQSNCGNAGHACSEDIVVLFSSNWCGFCQRMELIVREVTGP
ncbi:hypothetical protein F3Y22_tig00111000pilonHSYRG00035 [Hibiscus syriacus]|uniref:Thioredoxin domain-containing protein n=1 Tax=Hibiscus syriacus TaxID=106335 RepID=A0A6A2Z810_HIBSY|nr:hypothetical protein F3Y22_tig00111000pilonHSYRG00035 [Hibiscus syriacus]